MRAQGSFAVTMTPQSTDAPHDAAVGRLWLDKQFAGDLIATSQGQMLAAQGGVAGSAGYVALERVTGALHGRSGSFVLQHSGTLDRGAPQLRISVVPDSGTDALLGLSGEMQIDNVDGAHSYDFHYTLPE